MDNIQTDVSVIVTTVIPPTEEQKQKISEMLSSYLHKPVSLKIVLDPQILAGMTLEAGNLWIDASLKNKAQSFQEHLKDIANKIFPTLKAMQDAKKGG